MYTYTLHRRVIKTDINRKLKRAGIDYIYNKKFNFHSGNCPALVTNTINVKLRKVLTC